MHDGQLASCQCCAWSFVFSVVCHNVNDRFHDALQFDQVAVLRTCRVQPAPYAVNLRLPRTPRVRFGSRTALAHVEGACRFDAVSNRSTQKISAKTSAVPIKPWAKEVQKIRS